MEGTRNSLQETEGWVKDMMNRKGNIRDFWLMYKAKILPNDLVYDSQVKAYSNKIVKEWYETSLKPNAGESGLMTAKEATERWYCFFETYETRLAYKNWDLCFHSSQECLDKWLYIFDTMTPANILKTYGEKTVRDAYNVITCAWDDWFVKKKYKRCFHVENDPEECLKNFKEHRLIFTQEQSPFKLQNIRDKIAVIMNPNIEPIMNVAPEDEEKLTGADFDKVINFKFVENDTPYAMEMKKYYKDLVLESCEFCGGKDLPIREALASYFIYIDVTRVKTAIKHWDMVYHPSDELVQKWVEIFTKQSPGEIAEYGFRTVRDGYIVVNTALDDWVCRKKYEVCKSNDINECCTALKALVIRQEDLPIDIDKIAEKVMAITKYENKPGPKREKAVSDLK